MGPEGTSRFAGRVYLFFFLFIWVGGPEVHKLRQFVALTQDVGARHFVALTQDVAVRGYVALTSGSRALARGARLIIFFVY